MPSRTRFSRWRRFERDRHRYDIMDTPPVNTWDSRAIGGTDDPFRFAGGGAPRQDKREAPTPKSYRLAQRGPLRRGEGWDKFYG